MALKFNIPVGIEPSSVYVTLKDRDLILRYEDEKAKEDKLTKIHYYQVYKTLEQCLPNMVFENHYIFYILK